MGWMFVVLLKECKWIGIVWDLEILEEFHKPLSSLVTQFFTNLGAKPRIWKIYASCN
jgi:hypothetical protein